VVAVTGSNGKTSAKEAIASLLQHLGPTLKTQGNLNTETGVPLTLLRLNPEHTFAVIEMGAQWVGEIAGLCRIAPPDIAVVTVVGPEHLEFFGSMENVVEAESEAVAALPPDGVAILNDDDAQVRRMAHRTPARAVTYGRRPGASVRALRITGDPLTGRRFTLTYEGEHARVRLNVPGEHAVTTALAAASVALTCGMSLSLAATCLAAIRPVKRRGEVKRGVLGVTLVDDTYNANRQSAVAAISLLKGAGVPKDARRWFVFGDMLELGAYSHDEHAAVGTAAAGAVDELVLVGADVHATADAARRAGIPAERIHYFAAPIDDAATLAQARADAAGFLRSNLRAGDVVLVKGSLGVGMDAVVAALLEGCDDNHALSGGRARP
jgi:UDP-N-acetylmuramoyl-tripeptide--D-alanyl-D-alanine ligase